MHNSMQVSAIRFGRGFDHMEPVFMLVHLLVMFLVALQVSEQYLTFVTFVLFCTGFLLLY